MWSTSRVVPFRSVANFKVLVTARERRSFKLYFGAAQQLSLPSLRLPPSAWLHAPRMAPKLLLLLAIAATSNAATTQYAVGFGAGVDANSYHPLGGNCLNPDHALAGAQKRTASASERYTEDAWSVKRKKKEL